MHSLVERREPRLLTLPGVFCPGTGADNGSDAFRILLADAEQGAQKAREHALLVSFVPPPIQGLRGLIDSASVRSLLEV